MHLINRRTINKFQVIYADVAGSLGLVLGCQLGWDWFGLVFLFGTGTGILWAPRPCYETMQEIIFYEPLAGLLCLRTPYVRDGNLTGKGQVVRGYVVRGPGPFHRPRVQLNDFGKGVGHALSLDSESH